MFDSRIKIGSRTLTTVPAEALDYGVFVWIAEIAYWVDRRMNRKIRQAREAKQPTPYPRSRYATDHWWDDGCDTYDQLHP